MDQLTATDRRRFLTATGTAFAALMASGCTARTGSLASAPAIAGYGPLVPDPAGFLDLPQGFSYRVISKLGDSMSDGLTVPDRADGMGCFDLGNGKLALVRNHELMPTNDAGGDIPFGYDTLDGKVMAGGTTTLVLDAATLKVEQEYRSLAGTIRNCAGGITPWGSWLTCEEAVIPASDRNEKNHGWVFEVPANAGKLVNPEPLKAMGRFNHEAAAVDPATGYVYETEDRGDSLLYRFVPKVPGKLAEGGKLHALALMDGTTDSRNWDAPSMKVGDMHPVRWIDLDDVEAPEDDLRQRGAAKGAVLFARGEGIHMGDGELYFCCTNGGAAKLGQVFRLRPGRNGGPDALDLFFESTSPDQFNYGDNLTVAQSGHLIVCEDQYTDTVANHLRGITPQGDAYPLALLREQTEPAGACFSPDGKVLFVNSYSPTATLAITGPWIT
ncbi:MAG: alkaline phosphatase PhoX [Allopontixanthobacter sediminis]